MTASPRANRGPGAARENRLAIVAAATEVFAEQGIDAPLNAVAKRAGVGQGVLYRHFPDRVGLALAAFDTNVAEIEALAADPDRGLDDLFAVLTRQMIDSVAFVDIVTGADRDSRLEAIHDRVRSALAGAVDQARRAGVLRPVVTVDEVMLAVGLIASLVAKVGEAERRATAEAAWSLLDRALRP
ncbi:TetR/AcrR family transcriptional regulator [Amorphoplanes digitatis]|uniref:AcrR family transcriptional regulator n=1 Tax=Actinoplanes digitatis TaxID=1868 RepID=A0A7W7MRK0_9ACTN|nr:TetR/AcrR family transcriptional regulator [Actinoplanes digitatis]MBB4763579.1 AcrR family transcriptional regulator [Actinoplanes digitatis]BFE72731.1 TetR/AcrR family transcriptional regulator [Actinoplanes digitatis]GID93162.1 TetR family transcriptional regulator [Actinoplanes digitatis]